MIATTPYSTPNTNSSPLPDLINQIKNSNTSQEEIIKIILDLGKSGTGASSNYYKLIYNSIDHYPGFGALVATTNFSTGYGWGASFQSTYGLTYSGIKQILAIKKINAAVADNLKELKQCYACLSEGSQAAFITDAGLLKRGKKNFHAVAVFLQFQKMTLKIMILDSAASSYDVDEVIKQTPRYVRVLLSTANNARQLDQTATCYAFAIKDCQAFQENPNLMNEISRMNPKSRYIERFPKELDRFNQSADIQTKALKYQAILLYKTRESALLEFSRINTPEREVASPIDKCTDTATTDPNNGRASLEFSGKKIVVSGVVALLLINSLFKYTFR
jgi:hypothetical protein